MITDLSDLIEHLEKSDSTLNIELDEVLRVPLRSALLLGLKQSLQHPACPASPKAHVELSKVEVIPDNGAAYRRCLAAFDYQDHQIIAIKSDLMKEATGWLGYIAIHDDCRALVLSSKVESAIAEQQSPELLALPLSLVHEVADWVQSILRNDTSALGKQIRKAVKASAGIEIPQPKIPSPYGSDDDEEDDEDE